MKAKTLIQALDRAVEILEIIRDAESPMRAANIAKKMDLPLKTAHNLIRSLYLHGYLVQDEGKNYMLGPECFLLTEQANAPFRHLAYISLPIIQKLCRETGHICFVGAEYCGYLYCAAVAYQQYSERNGHQSWLYSIHASACGRVLWAEHTDEELKTILSAKFIKFNSFTKTDPKELKQEILKCREQGFALVCDEHVVGSSSLAVPIKGLNGHLLGGLTCSFPTQSWENGKIDPKQLLKQLHQTAAEIASQY